MSKHKEQLNFIHKSGEKVDYIRRMNKFYLVLDDR